MKTSQNIYPAYMKPAEVARGLQDGSLVEGVLRVFFLNNISGSCSFEAQIKLMATF